jgi:hypothetical protein
MRACYFVQTHVNPGQIHRLVRTLKAGSPEARVLIGHDFSGCHLDLSPLSDLQGVDLFGFEGPLDRAGMGIIEPYFTALDWLAEREVEFDWLIYLTGQDYPVLPLAEAEGFLARSGRDGFLSHWDIRARPGYWGESRRGLRRYLYQYREAPPWMRKLKGINSLQSRYHLSSTYGLRLGVRANPSPFSDAFPCYAGDQWQALSRDAALYLRTALRERMDLVEYFRHTLCPCEAIVQTLLVNARKFNFANDSLRYIDFAGSRDGRPRMLGAADLAAITGGRYHFARKIDSRTDGGLLDLLDDWVLAGSRPRPESG